MKVKLEDVAKVAEVSPTTVSRVLNNRGYISEKTRKKVQDAIEELNYYPNDIARSLFKKRTNFIGLVIPTVNNPFFSELVLYIENICAELGYKVILCNSLMQIKKEEAYARMLVGHQVDGIIVCSYNRGIEAYQTLKLPIVAIDHYLSKTIPVIGSDNYMGGKVAVQHLINQGCKKIIHINGPGELETPTQLRRKAYEDLVEHPITYELEQLFDTDYVEEEIRKIITQHPQMDGIFASDDLIAATCMRIAGEKGISVPEELKIIGYDGTATIRNLLPQLTTIKQPIKEIASHSVERLMKLIDEPDSEGPMEVVLPIELLKNTTT